jgi:hypothetical protein
VGFSVIWFTGSSQYLVTSILFVPRPALFNAFGGHGGINCEKMKTYVNWDELLFVWLKMGFTIACSVYLYRSGVKEVYESRFTYYSNIVKNAFASLVATLFVFTIIGELNNDVTLIVAIIPTYMLCYVWGSLKQKTT